MHIVIDDIDKDSFALRGFTPTPSFRVRFSSQTFGGTARLVPASELADVKTGSEFEVEIAQESVTGFGVTEKSGGIGVEPLLPLGDFKVRGTVRDVWFPSEPVGNRITCVQVGDADFCLQGPVHGVLYEGCHTPTVQSSGCVTAPLICNFDTLGKTRPEAAIDGAN